MNACEFTLTLPEVLRCTNIVGEPLDYCSRSDSQNFSTISPNPQKLKRWMVFDMDKDQSWNAAEESRLPQPTFTAVNRRNGHCHMGYLLSEPVSFSSNSHRHPIDFYDSIRRGYTYRLGADIGYTGFLCKNPIHERWDVIWGRTDGFELHELDDYLSRSDKRKLHFTRYVSDLGRNCTTFDTIRFAAYREVKKFKRDGKTEEDFREWLISVAEEVNCGFTSQMRYSEVKSIAKSVAKWTWNRFTGGKTDAEFSKIQSNRAKCVYKNPEWLAKFRPWLLP